MDAGAKLYHSVICAIKVFAKCHRLFQLPKYFIISRPIIVESFDLSPNFFSQIFGFGDGRQPAMQIVEQSV